MKKFLAVLLVFAMILSFSACGKDYKAEFEQIRKSFDSFILGEFEAEYNDILYEFAEAADEKDKDDMKELILDLQNLCERVKSANEQTISDISAEISKEAAALSGEFKKEAEKAISDAAKKAEGGKYAEAFEIFKPFMALAPMYFESGESINLSVSQVDCSAYPKVKLYLTATDQSGKTPKNLDVRGFTVIENGDGMRREIASVMQLDMKQGISINMVADASGSMDGAPIRDAKNTMDSFLSQVQYDYGDTVSLVVFSNEIETQTEFISDYSRLQNAVRAISSGGGTALYDTLYTSVQYTARQSGARCIIAFTDGNDEHSRYADQSDVIRIANDYKIPIFIIGIGSSANNAQIRSIAENTGGFYRNINSISDLSEIYNMIYRQQKEMYVLEYTADEGKKYSEHIPSVTYKSAEYEGSAQAYSFVPSKINPASMEGELEKAIGNYLESYVKAMNTSDPSHMLPYVIPNCPLYNTQKNYVNNDYYEELLSFYICSEVQYEGESSCVLSVHEVYNVKMADEPMYHHEQVASYRMKKDTDGIWKMYEFVGSVKNHL